MRFADFFQSRPAIGETAIHETPDGRLFGKVTRISGQVITIKWETGAQSIHRLVKGGNITIVEPDHAAT